MNLKDRLSRAKASVKKDVDMDLDIALVDKESIEKIFAKTICCNKNVLLLGDGSIDLSLISQYLAKSSKSNNIKFATNFEDIIENKNGSVNIVPSSSITQAVKVLELILQGYSTFLFCLNLNSEKYIIEKIKALISINFENLTDENINVLVGSSNLVIAYVKKNIDDEFYFSCINEVDYINKEIQLNLIYKFGSNEVEEKTSNSKKINKYKILKEKLKNKRNDV